MLYALRKSLIAAGILTALAIPSVQAVTPDELFEVLQRVESLENEVRFLRGENEQLRYDMEDMNKTQRSTFIRIDDRMDELFRAINSRVSSSSVPALDAAPVSVTSSAVSVAPVAAKPVVAEKKVAPVAKPVVAKAAPAVVQQPVKLPVVAAAGRVPAQEQSAYDAAFAKVKTQPAVSIALFRDFLKTYPSSSLAANAQYWLGEVMYGSRNYQGAIDEFVAVLQSYQNSPKAPDAAIKLGFSFYEMKNWVYARRTFEDVIRNFPSTNAAVLAEARLDKMKSANLY
ncbi:tol-pal system protein YbgF [Leucothrix mucor]|uniref:tol-pal system protein YbgF n=1 Tax=Leucothrix mucor TaxID=45248 RepID=UPI0003B70136|nr:tol-pal system protein YbgF [Leucothrix mucor]